MRVLPLTLAGLALAGIAFTAAVRADEDAKPTPRIEKAKAVVTSLGDISGELNKALAAAQTSGKQMPEGFVERLGKMSDDLGEAVKDARALTKPIKLADLTDAEKESLAKEIEAETGEPKEENPLNSWQQRAMERALDGADLSEEQEIAADEIVSKWFKEAWDARKDGDSKKSSDLKRARNKSLTKALGKKKARKVINNLDNLSGRWR